MATSGNETQLCEPPRCGSGVEFQAGAATVRVLFAAEGAVGGRIRITTAGQVRVDRPLAQAVMLQAGLALVK